MYASAIRQPGIEMISRRTEDINFRIAVFTIDDHDVSGRFEKGFGIYIMNLSKLTHPA
jgi:hypothetical protein